MKKTFSILLFSIALVIIIGSNQSVSAKSTNQMKYDPDYNAPELSYVEDSTTSNDETQVMALGICATEDSYEDNNSFSEAAKIPLYVSSIDYSYDYLYGTIDKEPWYCLGELDKDYYIVDAVKSSEMVVKLYSIPDGVDYDIKIYDSSQNFLKGSYHAGNVDEEITLNVDPGQYYIYIYSYSGYDEDDTYTLRTRLYRDTDEYGGYNIDNLSTYYKGAIWRSEVSLPEILNVNYIDSSFTPILKEIVLNKIIIWDGDIMEEVVGEISEYEQQLSDLQNQYNNARVTVKFATAAAGIPSGIKIVAAVATGTAAGTITITTAGIAAVVLIADYALKVESDLIDEHIDVVQDVQAYMLPLYNTNNFVIEISTIYILDDLHMSMDPYVPSYYYSNYEIIAKVFPRDEYFIYEDFKDYTSQKYDDLEYYNQHYFAGTIQLTGLSTVLSDNLKDMLELKKAYDKLNYINNWPFNWLD